MTTFRFEQLTLPPQPESVTAARHFLTYTLQQWGVGELVERVELAASEVLTNAVVHAGTMFEVALRYGDELVVSVRDGSAVWSAYPEQVTVPSWDAEGGRGLVLVEAVTDAWGVREEDHGKTVWFQVRAPQLPADATEGDLLRCGGAPAGPVTAAPDPMTDTSAVSRTVTGR